MNDTDSPLTKAADLLALQDRKTTIPLFVKAWGRQVLLRDPSAADRDEWEVFASNNRGQFALWRAKVAQVLLCDEAGKRIFTDRQLGELGEKSAAALHEIWQAGVKLLSVTDEEIEELEKNSDASP